MQAIDFDLIVTIVFSLLLCGSGVAAVSALPWDDGDMVRTVSAGRRLLGRVRALASAVVRSFGGRSMGRSPRPATA